MWIFRHLGLLIVLISLPYTYATLAESRAKHNVVGNPVQIELTSAARLLRRTRGFSEEASVLGCADNGFSAKISVGAFGSVQTFDVLVDTGSSTLAIAGASCCTGVTLPETYNPGPGVVTSSTTVVAQFNSGKSSFTGKVSTDQVSLAGLAPVSMRLVAIGTATSFFPNSACPQNISTTWGFRQGILGLSYSSLAVPGTDSYLDVYAAAYPTAQSDVFAMVLCQGYGLLWMGGYDASFNVVPPVFTPITNQQYYQVGLDRMLVGGTDLGLGSLDFGMTIVDSGTPKFAMSASVLEQLSNFLNTSASYIEYFGQDFITNSACVTVPGLTTANLNSLLPSIQLYFGNGVNINLKAISSYIEEIDQGNGVVLYCSGVSTQTAASGSPNTILGWSVMNQFMTVFDRSNSQVGFATTQICSNPTWLMGAWSSCSAQCGGGNQTRSVSCIDQRGNVVANSLCLETTPPSTQTCNTNACIVPLNIAVIVGSVVGGVVGLILIIVCVVLIVKYRASTTPLYARPFSTAFSHRKPAFDDAERNPMYNSPADSLKSNLLRSPDTPTHRALYAYEPAARDELHLEAGDQLIVKRATKDGWLVAKSCRTGKSGVVPGNYVESILEATPAQPNKKPPTPPVRPKTTWQARVTRVTTQFFK